LLFATQKLLVITPNNGRPF